MTTAELQAQKAAARDKKRYVRITYDGASCICESCDVDLMTQDLGVFELEDVWMTEVEWEQLPEFAGW